MNPIKRWILKNLVKGFPAPPRQFTSEDTKTGIVEIDMDDIEDIILYLNKIEKFLKE